jgi:EAL domain-containing protein (putative c-di-GMP-specific phosphodiesterase class I)
LAVRGARFGSQSLEALALLRPSLVALPAKQLLGPEPDTGRLNLVRRQVRVIRSLGADVVMEGVVDASDRGLATSLGISLGIGSGAGPMAIRRGAEAL